MMERNDQSFYDSIFKERCSHHYISGMKETWARSKISRYH
jgi:hypothetical protein